ncbi:MAG: electron transfer flavoprotein subunit beta [bacterium]|nr:MAG: electron transfer flavoprotein subunit beta [bacterium]
MKIAVCIKQVPDTETIIKIVNDTAIDESGIKWIINPYDEFAVEESIKIKERLGGDSSFTVYSIGPDRAESALRTCLALGADRVVHLDDPLFIGLENFLAATVLAAALRKDSYDLILFGKQAIDDDGGMTAAMTAQILDMPYISEISKLEFPEDGKAKASRLVEGNAEVWETGLPVLLSCQKGLNEPRLPVLRGIMQSKKKPIEKFSAEDLDLDAEKLKRLAGSRTRIKLESPLQRSECKVMDNSDAAIDEVAAWLKNSVGVI